jgi:hypothetical protein
MLDAKQLDLRGHNGSVVRSIEHALVEQLSLAQDGRPACPSIQEQSLDATQVPTGRFESLS